MTSELNWDIFIKNWNLLNNNQSENQKEKKRKIKNEESLDFEKRFHTNESRSNVTIELKNDVISKEQKNKKNKHAAHSNRTFDKSKKQTSNLESMNFE